MPWTVRGAPVRGVGAVTRASRPSTTSPKRQIDANVPRRSVAFAYLTGPARQRATGPARQRPDLTGPAGPDPAGRAQAGTTAYGTGTGSASSSRTRGATCVPYSSIDRIMSSCGRRPVAYRMSNREAPRIRMFRAIFRATVSGDPT